MERITTKPLSRKRKADAALAMIRARGAVRISELSEAGISASTVKALCAKGLIVQVARGVYGDPEAVHSASGLHRDIAEAWLRTGGGGVVCLTTAGKVHGLTDENAPVTIALPRNAAVPYGADTEGIAVVRWSDPRMFEIGVETISMCGAAVRVTTAARTVADMLRRRNRQFRPDGTNMLGQYVREGGDLSEVRRIAGELGFLRDLEQELTAAHEVAKWMPSLTKP